MFLNSTYFQEIFSQHTWNVFLPASLKIFLRKKFDEAIKKYLKT